jgi:hypothetical protein
MEIINTVGGTSGAMVGEEGVVAQAASSAQANAVAGMRRKVMPQ